MTGARGAVVAVGAISPLGRGAAAYAPGAVGEPARVALAHDAELASFGLARPSSARATAGTLGPGRADTLLAEAAHALEGPLAAWLAQVGAGARVGLVVGTSSGAMLEAERLFEDLAGGRPCPPEVAARATYAAPFEALAERLERAVARPLSQRLQLVTACAASTWALGIALRWLRAGACDLVIAGGYDALSRFVATGFEALRATTATAPRPFRVGRDGMSLGEGAALVAVVREGEEGPLEPRWLLGGFGAATDAVHVTAPDRTGDGLARAARAALVDAGVASSGCCLVSAHATATPFNDAMEARALETTLGPGVRPVVHPMKAQIGHTLGAAGVLETLALAEALRVGLAPAAAGEGAHDPDASVRLLQRAEPLDAPPDAYALKLSAAFGGANAALVVERASAPPRPQPRSTGGRARLVATARVGAIDLERIAAQSGVDVDKLARLDEASLLFASAVAGLGERDALHGAGVVVGHLLATIDVNERFFRRVLDRGPRAAEARLFPPTSPNVAAGQVAILFGLRGPSAATASGASGGLDALRLGLDLVAAGDVQRLVIGAVDVEGPASAAYWARLPSPARVRPSRGAVAALLERDDAHGIDAADLEAAVAASRGAPLGHGELAAVLEALTR